MPLSDNIEDRRGDNKLSLGQAILAAARKRRRDQANPMRTEITKLLDEMSWGWDSEGPGPLPEYGPPAITYTDGRPPQVPANPMAERLGVLGNTSQRGPGPVSGWSDELRRDVFADPAPRPQDQILQSLLDELTAMDEADPKAAAGRQGMRDQVMAALGGHQPAHTMRVPAPMANRNPPTKALRDAQLFTGRTHASQFPGVRAPAQNAEVLTAMQQRRPAPARRGGVIE